MSWTNPGWTSSALRTAPPTSGWASRTSTDQPRSASRFAATRPFGPAPTTTASWVTGAARRRTRAVAATRRCATTGAGPGRPGAAAPPGRRWPAPRSSPRCRCRPGSEPEGHLGRAGGPGAGAQLEHRARGRVEHLGVVVDQQRPAADRVVQPGADSGQWSSTSRMRDAPTTHSGYSQPSARTLQTCSGVAATTRLVGAHGDRYPVAAAKRWSSITARAGSRPAARPPGSRGAR